MATPETNPRWLPAAAVLLALSAPPLLGEVPEPETVFYGRVVNRTTAQEHQLTSGTLTMVVAGEGGASVEARVALQPHAGGKYSYVLRLPHQAKSLDLSVDEGALPLRPADAEFESLVMDVDGHPARPLGSGASSFVASQPKRGGAHRLDLEVLNELPDSDGDGIPDWWEDLHGLDKQDPTDALLRWGSMRYTYLEAFLLGLDPGADDSVPELLTSELTVMEGGATGLLPRAAASAGPPDQLVYRITALPVGGDLVLRNARPDPRRPHRTLRAGDSFTQAEVDAGLLEFVHKDPAATAARLGVSLSNANPETGPAEREILLTVFSPEAIEGRAGEEWLRNAGFGAPASAPGGLSPRETWLLRATAAFADDWVAASRRRDRIAAFLLALRHGYTVWDGSLEMPARNLRVPSAGLPAPLYRDDYLPRYGTARSHVLFAGNGTSRVEGGMGHDILVAGEGETTLRGNGGEDVFVVSGGITRIEDFDPEEGDTLDLSPLLRGWPGPLGDKVEAAAGSDDTWLRIPLGDGEEAIVVLQGRQLGIGQLEDLRSQGRVFTGALAGAEPAANRPPVAVDDEAYASGSGPVSVAVLANDHDPDGDSLAVTQVTQGQFGTVQLFGGIAVYNPGHAFEGYDEFTYTISDGRGGTATGVVRIRHPFPAAAGRYMPLVFDGDGRPVGSLDLQLLGSGAFTAVLTMEGRRYSGRGAFNPAGAAEVALLWGDQALDLSLSFDFSDPSYPLSGTLYAPAGEGSPAALANFDAAVAAATFRQVPAEARRFTFATDPPEGLPGAEGFSAARIGISDRYFANVAGRLADGTPFTASAHLDIAGDLNWNVRLYQGQGWVMGRFSLDQSGGKTPSGTLTWSKPGPDGEASTIDLTAAVSAYVPPSLPTASAWDFSGSPRLADFSLHNGGLAQPLEATLAFRDRDAIVSDPTSVRLQMDRRQGLFGGSVVIDGVERRIHGVLLQDRNAGYGVFVGEAAAGAVEIFPR